MHVPGNELQRRTAGQHVHDLATGNHLRRSIAAAGDEAEAVEGKTVIVITAGGRQSQGPWFNSATRRET